MNGDELFNLGLTISMFGLMLILVYLKMIVTMADVFCYTLSAWVTIMILTAARFRNRDVDSKKKK